MQRPDPTRRTRFASWATLIRSLCVLLTFVEAVPSIRAQSVVDGSASAIGPEGTQAVLALIGRHLHAVDARVTGLRTGRAGGICGAVEVRNRTGTYTGPRGFVVDLVDGFVGRLPEGPELRNPGSVAEYRAMERARELFAKNCVDG